MPRVPTWTRCRSGDCPGWRPTCAVNPVRRELNRWINRLRNRLGMLRNRVSDPLWGGALGHSRQIRRQVQVRAQNAQVLVHRGASTHFTVAELGESKIPDALPSNKRLLPDVIHMITRCLA